MVNDKRIKLRVFKHVTYEEHTLLRKVKLVTYN